jgi:type I restriction enzyme S subunit
MSHYKPYPAYKDSGVEWLGKVPEYWSVKKIAAICKLRNGYPFNSQRFQPYGQEGSRLIRIRDLTPVEVKIFTDEICPDFARVIDGDLLIGMDGEFNIVRWGGGNAKLNQRVCALNASSAVEEKFILYALSTPLKIINDLAYSTTVKHLSSTEVLKTQVAIPSSNEELERIVDCLDRETARIDALVAKKTRFIELLREKRQALITQAVTKGLDPSVKMKDSGVEWLGEVPEHWQVVRFRDLCVSISTGPFGTALGNEDYVNGGVPVINPSHIVDSKICADADVSVSSETANRLGFWRLAEGDLVAARRGELGRAAVVMHENDGWLCGTGSLRVRPRSGKSSVDYLHAVLQSRYAREWLNQSSVGATMANLNEGILGSLPVAVPLDVAEQAKIVEKMNVALSRLDVLDEKNQRSIELLKERRSALITAAVTGQIDLREAA